MRKKFRVTKEKNQYGTLLMSSDIFITAWVELDLSRVYELPTSTIPSIFYYFKYLTTITCEWKVEIDFAFKSQKFNVILQ